MTTMMKNANARPPLTVDLSSSAPPPLLHAGDTAPLRATESSQGRDAARARRAARACPTTAAKAGVSTRPSPGAPVPSACAISERESGPGWRFRMETMIKMYNNNNNKNNNNNNKIFAPGCVFG